MDIAFYALSILCLMVVAGAICEGMGWTKPFNRPPLE